MEDRPASALRPTSTTPSLSVVIPVLNGGAMLERCLRKVRSSTVRGFELIVVDDGSTDDSASIAQAFGATLLTHREPRGPAAARNAGARIARGEIVFFLDADILIEHHALERALDRFARHPDLMGLFGSYDDRPSQPDPVSQFRNLLHHFVHQQGRFDGEVRSARTFWTGLGAYRRHAFMNLGGFDPELYRRPAIEDIEFGYRATASGHRIELIRNLQGTHMKSWSLYGMVRTDLLCRGVPWMLLQWRRGVHENDLNVRPTQKLSVALTALALLTAAVSPIWPILGLVPPFSALGIVCLNAPLYRFFAARRGLGFAITALPLHVLYYLTCGVSVILASAIHHAQRLEVLGVRAPGPIGRSALGGQLRADPGGSSIAAGHLKPQAEAETVGADRPESEASQVRTRSTTSNTTESPR